MRTLYLSSKTTENFLNNNQVSTDRWNLDSEYKFLSQKYRQDFDHNLTKQNFKSNKKCPVKERSAGYGDDKYVEGDGTSPDKLNDNPELNNDKQRDTERNDDLSLDFSWLTKDLQVQGANDCITCGVSFDPFGNDPEQSLSQRSSTQSFGSKSSPSESNYKAERRCIEEEIRQKYAEINVMLKQIHSRRRKRRRKMQVKNYDVTEEIQINQWDNPKSNICPIKRRKRSAQPIRNALLVRTAMRKAWKGMLGSCCGKGCWATWKWVNLKGVMSDYE